MKEDGRWKDDRCDVFIEDRSCVYSTVHTVYTHDMCTYLIYIKLFTYIIIPSTFI